MRIYYKIETRQWGLTKSNGLLNVLLICHLSLYFLCLQYLPPARPNEISIHELLNTTQKSKDEIESLFSINVTMEIIPTSCDYELPLIEFYPVNASDPSMLYFYNPKGPTLFLGVDREFMSF